MSDPNSRSGAGSIEVRDVGKRYVKYDDAALLVNALRFWRTAKRSSLWALRDINFAIDAGEVVGIIGQNGSGKTTLLRMLAAVTAPTTGTVRVAGRVAPLISVGVGFHHELSGRENVYVNATILGMTRKDIDRRFDEIVEFAEVADFIDTPVKFYSSGMSVRLGFSVALAARPEVLLIDEVLAVGDIAFQLKCYERMAEIRDAGTTVVFVSHNLSAVRGLCKRTILLNRGQLRYDGDTTEAISLYHELLQHVHEDDVAGGQLAGTLQQFELHGGDGQPTNFVSSTDEVTVVAQVKFARAVKDPIVGVSIVNQSGVPAYTDTTPWTGFGQFEAGSTAQVRVRFQPRLATGSYTLHFALNDPSGTKLISPPPPLRFYVGGRELVTGIADLGAKFDIHVDGQLIEVEEPAWVQRSRLTELS